MARRVAPPAEPASPPDGPYRIRLADATIQLLRPGEIADHPLQHKAHPPHQRAAMEAACREVGIADVLLIYRSTANGGQITAVDGHLRKSLDPHQPWPCVMLDVDDDEAAYLLLTHDEIGKLAELLRVQTGDLLRQTQSQEQAVQELLASIAIQVDLPAPTLTLVPPGPGATVQDNGSYGVEGDVDEDGVSMIPVPAPDSNIRMAQLYLTNETYPAFLAMVQQLGRTYGLSVITDIVLECLRRAVGVPPPPDERADDAADPAVYAG